MKKELVVAVVCCLIEYILTDNGYHCEIVLTDLSEDLKGSKTVQNSHVDLTGVDSLEMVEENSVMDNSGLLANVDDRLADYFAEFADRCAEGDLM